MVMYAPLHSFISVKKQTLTFWGLEFLYAGNDIPGLAMSHNMILKVILG